MKLAVISDVHGNLEALQEVLYDIDHSNVDAVVCLGDNIGYGPDPEKVIQLVRQRRIPCVMGNHEWALRDQEHLSWFNPEAQMSILLTRNLLSQESLSYIYSLPSSIVIEGCLCVHGAPPDSITTYLFELSSLELQTLFTEMPIKVTFVGHTHTLEIIRFDGKQIHHAPLHRGIIELDRNDKCIINVGSVGQPRDSNNNAKYVIWDTSLHRLEVRFIPYDIEVTVRKILDLGFPEFNAARLW